MKSHFLFSNQQRNGILLLLLIIVVIQIAYIWVNNRNIYTNPITDSALLKYRKQIDSLKQIENKQQTTKIYPFNPNFITDYKGYTLGMRLEEINRLHQYRAKGLWVNSAKDFQQVTHVSDSLLHKISPYFKFPEWLNSKNNSANFNKNNSFSFNQNKTYIQKQDLNTATNEALEKVYGVGPALSKRIITYREKYGGFIADVELSEIYGLSPEVITEIIKNFTVKTPRKVNKINLNTASRDLLVQVPYLDYENVKHIIEARTLKQRFSSFEELTKIEDFPIKKLEIIKLYLHL